MMTKLTDYLLISDKLSRDIATRLDFTASLLIPESLVLAGKIH